jgi:hypothetical protein
MLWLLAPGTAFEFYAGKGENYYEKDIYTFNRSFVNLKHVCLQ